MDLMQQIIALDAQPQASEQVYVTGIGNRRFRNQPSG